MTLRALGSLVSRRLSPRGPRAQVQTQALGLASRSSSRSIHTLRDLDFGDGAFGALAVGGFAVLFLYLKKDESGREVNMYKDPAIRAKFMDRNGKVAWADYIDYINIRKKHPKLTDEEILDKVSRYHRGTASEQEDARLLKQDMRVEVDESVMKARFEEWMKDYGRSYTSEEEKSRRYEIFKLNAIEADSANASFPNGLHLAPNNLGDWTKEELSCLYMHQGDRDWEQHFDELGHMQDRMRTDHCIGRLGAEQFTDCPDAVKQCYMKLKAKAAEQDVAAGGRTMGRDGASSTGVMSYLNECLKLSVVASLLLLQASLFSYVVLLHESC